MERLRLTRFGLRLLGLVLLWFKLVDVWDWASPLASEGLSGNWKFVQNMAPAPFQGWFRVWPDKLEWLLMLGAGLVLVFWNQWLARLLWRGLEGGGCIKCGYDRSGIDAGAPCPECGLKD